MSEDVKNYINNVLDERRQEFGGKAVCPFAAPELKANRLIKISKLFIASLRGRHQ